MKCLNSVLMAFKNLADMYVFTKCLSTFRKNRNGGALGLSVLRIWLIIGSVLRFSVLRISVLRISVFFSVGSLFLSMMMAVFRIFLSNTFYGFSGFGQGNQYTLQHLHIVLPFLLEERMTSLVC